MSNALAHEKSPYLLQHADNPVQWLPWGEAAFAKARTEDKPIFLSIGYSTCHWCHVMAHESFESEAIAAILNEHFVPVKVDREERPDVDRVYMTYVQAMTGQGGWPLNAWLTPSLTPFYAGTYFPPEERHGRSSFATVLKAIVRGWSNDREKLVGEADRLVTVLQEHYSGGAAQTSDASSPVEGLTGPLVEAASGAFERGFQHFYESFDAAEGGFGGAPKFPRAANLNFLFRVTALQGADSELGREAIQMAATTLSAMARGGIHDHVGGGFHRYAVDGKWFVPHFEKMLYDQAQIALNYLEAKQATGDERFAWLARDVFDYVLRDLAGPDGGFYTAEDADSLVTKGRSAHAEGAFYVWTQAEIVDALAGLAAGTAEIFCAHYGVAVDGNVPPALDPQAELRSKNILVQRRPLVETARQFGLTLPEASDRLVAALARLREARAARPRPHRDDKILTANNGLMISALARAHQVLGATDAPGSEGLPSYLDAAIRAARFVERELHDKDRGVLYRGWRQGRGAVEGFAEDYAFFIQALLDLYEATFDVAWLQWAERLQATMDGLFWDERDGAYYNSTAADRNLVLRLKEDYDGAEPAPSSVAALNLFRLGAMLNRDAYREHGRRTVEALRPQWAKHPHALPQLLCAVELALEPPRHVVIAGDPAQADFQALVAVLHERLGPRRVLLAADGGAGQSWLASRAPWLAEMKPQDGRATAYVCEEFACQAPVTDPAALRRQLG